MASKIEFFHSTSLLHPYLAVWEHVENGPASGWSQWML